MGDGQLVTSMPSHRIYETFSSLLVDLAKRQQATVVGELGGGARPLLGDDDLWGFVDERVVLDISQEELDKAADELEKRQVDLCRPLTTDDGAGYDMVFSKMLCEHLPDPEVFHRNCLHLLKPGGVAVHFFPTLWALPFTLNWVIPESLARGVVRLVQPGRLDDPRRGKFPAYYRWCRGPSRRSLGRFQAVGFEVEEWRTGFGHTYYQRVAPLRRMEDAKSRWLVRHPRPALSAYAVVVLRKPV
jgi:SAM-dependent methyltransferase